ALFPAERADGEVGERGDGPGAEDPDPGRHPARHGERAPAPPGRHRWRHGVSAAPTSGPGGTGASVAARRSTSARVLASAGERAERTRTIRGKRRAYPDPWRAERWRWLKA